VRACTRLSTEGLQNLANVSPAVIAINHLGDLDAILVLSVLPRFPESLAKIELHGIPVLGRLMDMLGVIWVHRGQADRRAIRAALEALERGRVVVIAPEGRESVTGSLEEGTEGAAYLAIKAGVPVIPMTITGSESRKIENSLLKFHRTPITIVVGKPLILSLEKNQRAWMQGTRLIMESLARQLPSEYRGVYVYV
jgi:1-acyl-sn-glycerol-3-phosphate acyltransferase